MTENSLLLSCHMLRFHQILRGLILHRLMIVLPFLNFMHALHKNLLVYQESCLVSSIFIICLCCWWVGAANCKINLKNVVVPCLIQVFYDCFALVYMSSTDCIIIIIIIIISKIIKYRSINQVIVYSPAKVWGQTRRSEKG